MAYAPPADAPRADVPVAEEVGSVEGAQPDTVFEPVREGVSEGWSEEGTPSVEELHAGEEETTDVGEVGPRTRTMAELYARQGLHDRAVEVYEHLLAESPGDDALRSRLGELRAEMGEGEAEGVAAEEAVETAARHMSESGHHEPVDSPFSWAETAAETEGEARATGGTPASEYFAELLAWEPAEDVVDIAELTPDHPAEEAVDIAELAPDHPAEEVVDIAELAPDEPAEDVVDIAELAPDEPVGEW
jgi:hypothetical protein